jgi:hypothetical protein
VAFLSEASGGTQSVLSNQHVPLMLATKQMINIMNSQRRCFVSVDKRKYTLTSAKALHQWLQ